MYLQKHKRKGRNVNSVTSSSHSNVFTCLASIGPRSVTRLVSYWLVARPLFFCYISPTPRGWFRRDITLLS